MAENKNGGEVEVSHKPTGKDQFGKTEIIQYLESYQLDIKVLTIPLTTYETRGKMFFIIL